MEEPKRLKPEKKSFVVALNEYNVAVMNVGRTFKEEKLKRLALAREFRRMERQQVEISN